MNGMVQVIAKAVEGVFFSAEALSREGVGAGRMGAEFVGTLEDADNHVGQYFD